MTTAPTLADQVAELERRNEAARSLLGEIIATVSIPTNLERIREADPDTIATLLDIFAQWRDRSSDLDKRPDAGVPRDGIRGDRCFRPPA